MKKYISFTLLVALLGSLSCTRKPNFGLPNVDIQSIKNDFGLWWTYHNTNIVLSSNFIALDNLSNRIRKEVFLKSLTSGDFIPLKLQSKDSVYYMLFKLEQTCAKSIRETIKSNSAQAYKNFSMEGKEFPKFNFTDINGNEFNNENTKGKTVILKCWFIACKACVAEFPQLNELAEKYKNRNDLVFVSLAFDAKNDLMLFLQKTPFSYSVIPNQKQFMENDLDLKSYPTHIIIDQKGVILKVVNTADEMISLLEHEILL